MRAHCRGASLIITVIKIRFLGGISDVKFSLMLHNICGEKAVEIEDAAPTQFSLLALISLAQGADP